MEPMEPQSPATAAASAAAKTIQITSDLDTPISARLISVLGLFVMIAIAWAMSTDRKKVPWRIMAWGIGLQVALGFVVLRTDLGRKSFVYLKDAFTALLEYYKAGADMVLGGIATDRPFVFILAVLPTIIFFSSLMAVLYHLRIMQALVGGVAWLMRRTMGTSGAESLLERPLTEWLAGLPAGAALHSPRAFLSYAIDCLLDLRDGTGWDSEYQRDVWLLRRLGIAGHGGARLDFTAVQPVWLRDLAKRWCRWRMSCGIGLGQLRKDRIAIVRFSRFTPGLANSAGPGTLDRAALEAYLARLAVEIAHPKRRCQIVCVGPGKGRISGYDNWCGSELGVGGCGLDGGDG